MPELKRTSGSRFFARKGNIGLDSESSLVADSGKDADTQYILINFTDANLKTAKLSVHGREAKKRAESGGNARGKTAALITAFFAGTVLVL